MDTDISRKIIAAFVCLGFCVFAQAQVQVPEPRLPRDLPESRLPGEPPPPFALKWGELGAGTGQFHDPFGIAVDTSGNIYVADIYNHRIQKFDGNGTFITTWGSIGHDEGEFESPGDVVVDASGNVYVMDTYADRVQKFDSNGTFLLMWGWGVDDGASSELQTCTSGCHQGLKGAGDGQFDFPLGIGVDAAGNVYVADSGNDRIQKFDSSGVFLGKWGSFCDTSVSGVDGCDGQFDNPRGVVVDVVGNIYVSDTSNFRIQKFASNFAFIRKWGTGGNAEGQFWSARGIALDVSGNVYVADPYRVRIQKFDNSGNFLVMWGWGVDDGTNEPQTCGSGCESGITGSGDGQFDYPQGLAIDTTGNVYVADADNHRIQKFSPPFETLAFITEWGMSGTGEGQFDDPVDVEVDTSGNVYVADFTNERIQKFDGSGTFITQWGSIGSGDGQFLSVEGVAADSSGNVYVTDSSNDRVQKFDRYGNFLTKWDTNGTGEGEFVSPFGVAVDASDNVYVTDSGNYRVQMFDSSGTFLRMWGWGVQDGTSIFQICTSVCQAGTTGSGDGQFNAPRGVAVDASGSVYVVESGNDRIQKFDSSGTFITKWGTTGSGDGQFTTPFGVEVDVAGNVYVADANNDRIQKFDSSGTFITKWGTGGSGAGQLLAPQGVALDVAGNVYVADTANDRIQKFGPCSFSTSPTNGLIGFAGGATTFDIDAISTACSWTVAPNDAWITVTSGDAGIGDGPVGYTVDPNPTGLPRAGTVTLTDRSTGGPGHAFAILQDPSPCTYGLSSSSASFSGTSGADFLNVTGLLGCAWTAVSNDGWISVDAGAAGNGSGVVLYSVAANAGSSARSGTMTIAGHTFTVNQDPQIPDAPGNLASASRGSTRVDLAWDDNATNETWIRVERKQGAAGTFGRILALPADTTATYDPHVKGSTTYVYRVKACNSAGCSAPSNEVTETTPAFGVFIGEEPDQR